MRRFLIEAYTPAHSEIDDIEDRARRAAAELSASGTPVRYMRPIFVPEDETCFYLLHAESHQAASEALRRAGVSPQRITEAVDGTATKEDQP
jgi:hypothetical protein